MDENNNGMNPEPEKKSPKFFTGFLVGILVAVAVLLAAFVGYRLFANRTAWVNARKKQTQTEEASYKDKLDLIMQYLDAYYVGEYDEKEIETGLKKMGAIIGDYVEVGCNAVLNPGVIIGRNSIIYPTSCVRGVVKQDSVVTNTGEILPRK